MTAADVLDAAADRIDEVGWWDGSPNVEPAFKGECAAQAIHSVLNRPRYTTGDSTMQHPATRELARRVRENEGNSVFLAITHWNDGAHQELVTKTMRSLAADLRAGESA